MLLCPPPASHLRCSQTKTSRCKPAEKRFDVKFIVMLQETRHGHSDLSIHVYLVSHINQAFKVAAGGFALDSSCVHFISSFRNPLMATFISDTALFQFSLLSEPSLSR